MLPVEVEGLVVEFGHVRAVDSIDLSVTAGSAVALVGRNGAGKSTTIRALAGTVPPTSGSVHIAGVNVAVDPLGAKRHLGYCPDVGGLIPRATAWEHLQLSVALRQLDSGWQSRATELLKRFDLGDAGDRITAGYSHGMGRRLSVILAAFHEPQVLLLDEPFDGVDPLGVDATLALIREARLRGSAVLVSTHLLPLAVESCDEAVVLRGGRVVASAPADDLAGEAGTLRYKQLLSSGRAQGSGSS